MVDCGKFSVKLLLFSGKVPKFLGTQIHERVQQKFHESHKHTHTHTHTHKLAEYLRGLSRP